MSSTVSSSAVNSQAQGVRHSVRQTRTNPSRTSKTLGRSSFAYGHGSAIETAPTPPAPHGFYPALTHFTDAITALPREFRRHNSLLKEVDAKAWALEENLLRLLQAASESQAVPYPTNPAPIHDGVVREDVLPKDLLQPPESPESKNRRLLFDRVRHTLTDLMMTADEKNHVITNANDELDRQLARLDTIFPYIAGEISDEARLGSLTHWAYSNKDTAKAAAAERPRREAASNKQDLAHALHEAEAASRSEARREAVLARKQRRAHADSDFDETRAAGSRKGAAGKSRNGAGAHGDHSATGHAGHVSGTTGAPAPTKRRKVDRPPPVETGTAMERTVSATGTTSGRGASKDITAPEAVKKRARAPNGGSATARKRNNTVTSVAETPILASSPAVGTFNTPRSAASPGPNAAARPQSSRAQQNSAQTAHARQRPSSSASNRVNSASTFPGPGPALALASSNPAPTVDKSTESKSTPKDGPAKGDPAPITNMDGAHRDVEDNAANVPSKPSVPATKREDTDSKPSEPVETKEQQAAAPPPPPPPPFNTTSKGRSSKNSTPVLSTLEPVPQRVRPTRSTDPTPAKRSQKKNGNVPPPPPAVASDEEESLHEGDDEEEEGEEPRYCYCNEVSFGEMVACDNDACPREWFHLSCVGMTKPPGKNVKWYCNECKENMRRSRNGK